MFTIENQGSNTFLVYQLRDAEKIDPLSLGMLTNNTIRNFAPVQFMQQDADRYLKYNISAKVSAAQYFSGSVKKQNLLGVFSGICTAFLEAEEYLLDLGSIELDLAHIYVDVGSCEAYMICLPLKGRSAQIDPAALFKSLVASAQFDQNENTDYVAKIISSLNSTAIFSLGKFKDTLETLKRQKDTKMSNPHSAGQVIPTVQAPVVPPPPPASAPQPASAAVQAPAAQPVPIPVDIDIKPIQRVGGRSQINQRPETNPQSHERQQLLNAMFEEDTPQKDGALSNFLGKIRGKSGKLDEVIRGGMGQQDSQPMVQPLQRQGGGPSQPDRGGRKPLQPVLGKPPVVKRTPQNPYGRPQADNGGYILTPPMEQPPAKPAYAPQPPSVQSAPATPVSPPAPPVPMAGNANFGETTVLDGGGIAATTVLEAGAQARVTPYLIRAKNNEKIYVNKPVFRIGKERSYADYYIGDNSAISRSHANILIRDGQYFIEDTNSTNRTSVNDVVIQSGTPIRLEHGTQLKLADEYFEFKLY